MARRAEGWKFVAGREPKAIRFTHQGERVTLSTGESDPVRAAVVAAQMYSDTIHGRRPRVARTVRRAGADPLDLLFASWLAAIEPTLDKTTWATYATTYVKGHWLSRWSSLGELHSSSVADYARERLGKVMRSTLSHELSALFGFVAWLEEKGHVDENEIVRPKLMKKLKGTRSGVQRQHAPEYSPEQIERALAALPEWSRSRKGQPPHAVRGRFTFGYVTGLRPTTLDEFEWSDIAPDFSTATIRDEADKNRWGRVIDLPVRARDVLRAIARAHGREGLVFGSHDFRYWLRRAAAAAGIPSIAPYDFRHAKSTHAIDAGASLTGLAYELGHRQITTLNRYSHPSRRAAKANQMAQSNRINSGSRGLLSGAKEGNRTPTRVTPLEPESRDNLKKTEKSRASTPQETARNRTTGKRSGSRDPECFDTVDLVESWLGRGAA